MPDEFTTLLDIMKRNQADPVVGLVEDSIKAHPEINLGAARTIAGTNIQIRARTAVPEGAGWRSANAGVTRQKSSYELRRFELFMIQKPIQVDKQVADSAMDGADAMIADEASGILEGALRGICSSFYYGLSALGDPAGTPGLIDMYDADNMVVDAGGTTANTGSSIWLIRWGPKATQWIYGNNRTLAFTPLRVQSIADPNDATKSFVAYCKELLGHVGVQLATQTQVVRIKNITEDAGKGATDKLISQALSLFPSGQQPSVITMTRRSHRQLQDSRTATNPTGAPAPFPREIVGIGGENIPIAVTDSIVNTEPLTL